MTEASLRLRGFFNVAHQLPGRVRLRQRAHAGGSLAEVASTLRLAFGVRGVRANARAQSITVDFDPMLTTVDALLSLPLPPAGPASDSGVSAYSRHARAAAVLQAPRAAVWSVVSDIEEIVALAGDRVALGEQAAPDCWELHLSIGGRQVSALARIQRRDPLRRLEVRIEGGVDALVAVELRDAPGGGTNVEEKIAFRAGGGLLGGLAAPLADRRLKVRLRRHLEMTSEFVAKNTQRTGVPDAGSLS